MSLVLSGFIVEAQTLWSEPELPTADQQIVVYFDATGTGIEGYTGDLYTHTGLNTSTASWQNVIGSWGENDTQPLMERIDTDLYQLVITPDVFTYYDADQSDEITQLCFVFRAEDASSQSSDLFLDIYTSGLAVSFQEPQSNPLVLEGETIDILIQANEADSVLLNVDGQIVERVAGSELSTSVIAQNTTDKVWLVAMAKNEDNIVYDSLYYLTRPDVTIAEMPAGMNKGVNYIDDHTVTLVLQAPYKEFVYVIGDFNSWLVDNTYYMNLDPDGEHFWLTIENLQAGQQYAYQFFIDGELKIADPYTEQISNPWNDHYISEDVYPGLIDYPSDYTEGNAAVLQTAQTPYEWEVEDFEMPRTEDLVVYECLVRDFTEEGTYAGVTGKLDYLEALGINVLELMPINEFEGNISWGYNPSFYFAPDKAYGPRTALKQLVDEAHKRGIAVVLDMVLNHSYDQSPLVQMYEEDGDPADNNPWYNREHNFLNTDAQWGNDFNHESPYTEALVDSINVYWMSEYKFDGFRFDFTKGFSNNIKDENDSWGSLYDADRVENLKRISDAIWAYNPDAIVSMEHLAENSEETELANYGILLWGNMNYNYSEATMGWTENDKTDLSWGSYQQRGWDAPNLLTYMESHDEERQMYKAITYGNQTNPDYDVQDLSIALKRAGLSAVFLFAIPGPKMIWQFGELGYDYSIDYIGRTDPKPVRWDYYEDYERKYLYDVYAAMAQLKTENEAFATTDYSLDVDDALKHVNLNGDEMDVVIIGNFDVEAGEITPEFQQTGEWYDYITGDTLQVTDVNQVVTLEPGEYRVYTSEKIDSSGLNVGVEEYENTTTINTVYPNPSESDFRIEYTMKSQGLVQIAVYDVFGNKVSELFDGVQKTGDYQVIWSPSEAVAKGVYLITITSDGSQQIRKVVRN